MARGAAVRAGVDLAVAVTGVAGPGGGTLEKPVGLVYLAVARKDGAGRVERRIFSGDRAQVRQAAMVEALRLLQAEADGP
jgi:nicotinamide-nucleotide amidase